MTPKLPVYRRVAERAARGEFDLRLPLDYKILAVLPKEGELYANLYPLGRSLSALVDQFPDGPPDLRKIINARLISLRHQKLVHLAKAPIGHNDGGNIYQRTPLAEKLLTQWKKEEGQNGNAG